MNCNNFLLDYFSKHTDATQEYQLLTYIEKSQPDFFPSNQPFSLFKKHFYLFHQLYKLNEELLLNDQCLIISALEIRLCNIGEAGTDIGRVDALKSFYLDESNLNLSEDEISQMMQLFWKKYMAVENKLEAIKQLGLQGCQDLTKDVVRKRYNELAKIHHPDKGGNEAAFVKIKNAYDALKLSL